MTVLAVSLCAVWIFGQDKPEKISADRFAILEIDGTVHRIIIDRETKLIIGGKEHVVKISVDPLTVFSEAGVSFKYSSRASCSRESSGPNLNMWNITGDQTVIMVQEYKMVIGEAFFVKSLQDQYAGMKAEVETKDAELKTAAGVFKGKELLIHMGEIRLSQQVFTVRKGEHTVLLILQDTLDEKGEHTDEFLEMLKAVARTLKTEITRPAAGR